MKNIFLKIQSKQTKKVKREVYSFTLVELIIVLAILALLAGFVIYALAPGSLLDQFNDQKRITELRSIKEAIDYLNIWAQGTLNLGTSTIVYLSLPDNTSTTCASYTLPPLPSGYSYSCKPESTYRKVDGTGWIPIDFRESDLSTLLVALPVDPVNDATYHYSYNSGGSYELNAFLKSPKYINNYASKDNGDSLNAYETGDTLSSMPLTFPHNWIKVPGNSLYGTSDFWVMQFEAKYSTDGHKASDAGNDVPPNGCRYSASYDTWDWGNTASPCPSSWSNSNVVSSPYGSPIAGVTHDEAKAICQSLGGHLITNQEWMTIARNVEQVPQNWTSGIVGTGYLFNGNSGDSSRGYDGPDPDKGNPLSRNPRAALFLSNGSKIYDFSGNVHEHVMKDINDTLVRYTPSDGGAVGWKWIEHTAITNYGDFSYNEIRPSNSSWDANQGMGRVYTYNGDYGSQTRVLLRGGNWDNGSYAGAFTLALDYSTSTQYRNVGFRCAR